MRSPFHDRQGSTRRGNFPQRLLGLQPPIIGQDLHTGELGSQMDRVAPQVHRLGRPHSSVGDDVLNVPLFIQAIERPYGEEPVLNKCRRIREIAGMRTPVGPSDYGATWIVCLEASGAGDAPRGGGR
jgi:hypothetical protein